MKVRFNKLRKQLGMNNMPIKLRKDLDKLPYYKKCARKDIQCKGRITWEHALYYRGRQIQEPWAIIPLCYEHHLGFCLDKRENELIALTRLFESEEWTKDAENKYPKAIDGWRQRLKYLISNKKQ